MKNNTAKTHKKFLKQKRENSDISFKEKQLFLDDKDDNSISTSTYEDLLQETQKIESIFSKKNKTKSDKIFINNFLKKIPLNIINYNNEDKINLILDLDNTLIYSVSYFNNPNNIFIPDKTFRRGFQIEDLETIRFSNSEVYVFRFRDELNVFFENTKNFCNYYFYSAALMPYAIQIIDKIKARFKIEIKSVIANEPNKKKEIKKSLNKLNLSSHNSIIIDDCPYFWPENLSNLLLSKRFYDYKIMNLLNKNYQDLSKYGFMKENNNGMIYFKSGGKQFENYNDKTIFFPFNVESNDFSERKQLKYLSYFIQKIHYLYFNFNITVTLAIKLLKTNIFYDKYFMISKDFINYEELEGMILYCGGTIVNSRSSFLNNLIIVEKENKKREGTIIVSEEYIYDCYYMLFPFDENDNYYHFRNTIELIE